MKNKLYPLLLCCFLLPAIGCKDVLFYPVKGSISGTITDNNGNPVAGISISATYDLPGQSPGQPPFPETQTTQTDQTGYFLLTDLWDEVLLSIQAPGFAPLTRVVDLQENDQVTLDLSLTGSPTVVLLTLSKQVISLSTPDSVTFDLEVHDALNQSGQLYQCNVLLQGANGTVAIIPASLHSQGLEHYLFEGTIRSEVVPRPGNFPIVAEVQDPDGLVHRYITGLSIQAQ